MENSSSLPTPENEQISEPLPVADKPPQLNKILLIVTVLLMVGAVGFGAYYFGRQQRQPQEIFNSPTPELLPSLMPTSSPSSEPVVCTMEAKICPDGTQVGRTGPNCEFAPCPQPSVTTSTIPTNWQTYTNEQYQFQISYPPSYKALDDADNLSGWPEGVLLLYKGGQAYDIVIEVWEQPADYLAKYGTGSFDYTVKQIDGTYITILNSTAEPDSAEIISSFTEL